MPNTCNPFSRFVTVHPRRCLRHCGGVFLALAWLALSAAQAQTTNYALGTASLLEGPAAGTDSVVLGVTPQTATWTNTANADWLHLSLANQTGEGSTNVIFSFDANPGPTRTDNLTLAGQTLTVTQAGSTYVAAGAVTTLVSSNLYFPSGMAVDGTGNVYIANAGSNAIYKWTPAKNTVTKLVTSGLSGPEGVAVDGTGNVYIADSGHFAIKKWTAANSNLTTLVSSGLIQPNAVAVDAAGDVYIADTYNNAIKEWTAANSNVTTLVSSGLSYPFGVAVDAAGNVYIADLGHGAIKEWTAANSNLTTLVSGLNQPTAVAVDGAGNVYIADYFNYAIKEWTAASSNVTTLVSSGLSNYINGNPVGPLGAAVDGSGNVYIADTANGAIKELPRAFVDTTVKLETLAAGSDAFPVVLPALENLLAPFAPASHQSWLTVTGITNGVVSFSFPATSSDRTGYITLLGQIIPVAQGAEIITYSLGTTALVEGPGAGNDSVVLAVSPGFLTWTNTANASWLHLSLANQFGAGSTNVIFSFDANPGATRTGTLTIGGQTLTVTQAGATYVAASPLTTLVSSGLSQPEGIAVDGAGNVYIADYGHNAVKEWTAANNTVTTLVSSGLGGASGVAVDGTGNVYIAANSTYRWTPANSNLTVLAYETSAFASGIAVDGAGNGYIADYGNNAIKEWTAADSNVTSLVSSGLSHPEGVAVDAAGNVYIADNGNYAIKELEVANNTVTTLMSLGMYSIPEGVAVDGSGNVYVADSYLTTRYNFAIFKRSPANTNAPALVSWPNAALARYGVAVDGVGNVYIADYGNNAIKEVPRAFVDPTPISESLASGSDALPVVLPATENLLAPFAPTCDQSWLTISGVANGVVSFSFTANTGLSRTANITLLGQTIAITQAGVTPPTLTSAQMQILTNGSCQFWFSNTVGASFTVLSSTDMTLPLSNWTVVGTASNTAPGQFQFTTPPMTNDPQRFYTVRSP